MQRDYQQLSVDLLRRHLRERPVLALPTGAGKTVIAAEIMRIMHLNGVKSGRAGRSLFLCDRREIVQQTADEIHEAGIPCGIILADHAPTDAHHQVAAVQTLSRRNQPPADLVFVDECRRALCASALALETAEAA